MNKMLRIVMLIGLFSCSDNEPVTLSGTYTETYPVSERTTLVFFGSRVKMKSDGVEEIYSYRIAGDKIILTLTTDQKSGTEHYFDLVNGSNFTIGDLYPHIPEYSLVYMKFEKQ